MDNCVIPHGYKATALGIIPQEWEVMLLGNLSNSISSGRNKHRDAHGQYPVFGSTGIIGYSSTYEYEGCKGRGECRNPQFRIRTI